MCLCAFLLLKSMWLPSHIPESDHRLTTVGNGVLLHVHQCHASSSYSAAWPPCVNKPTMQVVWMEDTFPKGFDADTPMLKNQGKTPRYYSNFQRALALMKEALVQGKLAHTAKQEILACGKPQQQQAILAAQTPEEMHQVRSVPSIG